MKENENTEMWFFFFFFLNFIGMAGLNLDILFLG